MRTTAAHQFDLSEGGRHGTSVPVASTTRAKPTERFEQERAVCGQSPYASARSLVSASISSRRGPGPSSCDRCSGESSGRPGGNVGVEPMPAPDGESLRKARGVESPGSSMRYGATTWNAPSGNAVAEVAPADCAVRPTPARGGRPVPHSPSAALKGPTARIRLHPSRPGPTASGASPGVAANHALDHPRVGKIELRRVVVHIRGAEVSQGTTRSVCVSQHREHCDGIGVQSDRPAFQTSCPGRPRCASPPTGGSSWGQHLPRSPQWRIHGVDSAAGPA